MDFSSLVLVERDSENNIIKEMGSYEVTEGAEYITKLYYDGECINLYFDTKKDVEEWEYTAIFDLFDIKPFQDNGFEIKDIDDEYNPTWQIKFEFDQEYDIVKRKLCKACELINEGINEAFVEIKGKEEEYV